MNEKASVTKELNARHRKIIEGLLKLPENRECADCKAKGPRWASVNLGVFICMQCSGIHRSLGTHISKVRSATLDTWLPEQVAFIQSMGNEVANSYWEADLPSKYDRVGIENFIRAKYEEKRWTPRDGKPNSSAQRHEERTSIDWKRPGDQNGHESISTSVNKYEEKKRFQASATKDTVSVARISIPMPPSGAQPVNLQALPQQAIQKPEASVPQTESMKQEAEAASTASPPKADLSTDLFSMLSMDDPSENDSGTAKADDNSWAAFQSAEASSTADKNNVTNSAENGARSTSSIEDLFQNSPSDLSISNKPQKDVKTDIMSLFEKTNMVSPFAAHQQQLAMLAQHQSLLMAAAAAAAKNLPGTTQQPGSAGTNVPAQMWPNVGYQVPGITIPIAGPSHPQSFMQVGNIQSAHSLGNVLQTSSTDKGAPTNGVAMAGSHLPSEASISSGTPSQTAKDYDFSSLTQGFFSKQKTKDAGL